MMTDEELMKKEEIEKLLYQVYKKEIEINEIEQKQNCLIVSQARTEQQTYQDNSKRADIAPQKNGYESFADIYIVPLKDGKLSSDIISIKEHSYQMQQNEWHGDLYYTSQPTTELRVYNSKKELIAYIEDDTYRDLLTADRFDLFSEGVGYPSFFSRRFLHSLSSKTGPSSAILREAEHSGKIGRYDEFVLRDLREQKRRRDLIKNGDEIMRKKQEKEDMMRRKIDETMDHIDNRRKTRQKKLESKKLPKVIKKIGKTGIEIDSRIQTAIAMKKIEKENRN